MLFLSQLLDTKVVDSSDKTVGRLKDILVQSKTGEYTPLDFLLVKGRRGKEYYIPYDLVENLSHDEIILKKMEGQVVSTKPGDDYLFLNRDVLDQQIVDLAGARVVRVNDLKLGLFEEEMCVLALDVSNKGILRRLGAAWMDFLNLSEVRFIDWRNAQPVKGTIKVNAMAEQLQRLHPADLANIVEKLSLNQGSRLVQSLDVETAAQVMEEINPQLQRILVNQLGPEGATEIIQKMSIDEQVDLMQMMPKPKAEQFLEKLEDVYRRKIDNLLQYQEDTAGGLMTTDFVIGHLDWTVERALRAVKENSLSMRSMLYIYVTDADQKFLGAISLRRLLVSGPKQKLQEIVKKMPNLRTLRAHQKINKIIKLMTKYNLYTAAVVDRENKLVGMVTIDDVMRCIAPKA